MRARANHARWLVPGLAGLVIVATAAAIAAWPLGLWWDREAEIEAAAAQLHHLEAIAAFGRQHPEALALPADADASGQFLAPGTAAIQAAAMIEDLKQTAATQAVSVLQASSLPVKKEDPLTLIGVNLQVEAPTPALYRFLAALRSHQPLYFVDELQLRTDGAQAADPQGEVALAGEISVYGAAAADAAQSQGSP